MEVAADLTCSGLWRSERQASSPNRLHFTEFGRTSYIIHCVPAIVGADKVVAVDNDYVDDLCRGEKNNHICAR